MTNQDGSSTLEPTDAATVELVVIARPQRLTVAAPVVDGTPLPTYEDPRFTIIRASDTGVLQYLEWDHPATDEWTQKEYGTLEEVNELVGQSIFLTVVPLPRGWNLSMYSESVPQAAVTAGPRTMIEARARQARRPRPAVRRR